MIVRTYGHVWDVDWRIREIPNGDEPIAVTRWIPGGVQLWPVAYFAALFAAAFLVRAIPLIGLAAGAIPAAVWYFALPGLGAWRLARARFDGRKAHHFARDLAVWGAARARGWREARQWRTPPQRAFRARATR